MVTITDFLTDDHRGCDERLAVVEAHVQATEWEQAASCWSGCEAALRRHFAREEELLFPAFEQATGSAAGPTAVMRMEHEQMRVLLPQLGAALAARDDRRFLALSESLMVLMQQHNMKEEQILYPMCDQHVPDREALLARMAADGADAD